MFGEFSALSDIHVHCVVRKHMRAHYTELKERLSQVTGQRVNGGVFNAKLNNMMLFPVWSFSQCHTTWYKLPIQVKQLISTGIYLH